MLSKDERLNRKLSYKNTTHILQSFKERGKELFGDISIPEMIKEMEGHLQNPYRSVIVTDNRKKTQSTHSAIFLTNRGKIASVPVVIEDDKMTILTLKDVLKDEINPNWHINQYNEIGSTRGLSTLPLHYRFNNVKV